MTVRVTTVPERVYRFRYRVGRETLAVALSDDQHRAEMITDALDDKAAHLVVERAHEIVAAVRLNFGPVPVARSVREALHLDRFEADFGGAYVYTSHLVIDPACRDGAPLRLLVAAAYKLARERRALFDFCLAPPARVAMYERLGYRQYATAHGNDGAGFRVPLVLLPDDVDYLSTIGSPLAALARGYPNRRSAARWFSRAFAPAPPFAAMSDDAFWHYLGLCLHEPPIRSIGLLDGLDDDDARRFVAAASVLRGGAGDVILRAGDNGDEMFVLLSGSVEVRAPSTRSLVPLARFGPGQMFGELGCLGGAPHSVNVIATTPVELLVLGRAFLDRAIIDMPAITARVLINLSRELCRRLSNSNQRLLDTAAAA